VVTDWRGIREGVGRALLLGKGTGILSRAIKYGIACNSEGRLAEGEPDSQ
jgi:hypothetical protein